MRTGTVYALTTPAGTPIYVGATVQSLGCRVGDHLRSARAGTPGPLYDLLRQTKRTGVWMLESGIDVDLLGGRERRHKWGLERAGFELLNYHHGGNGCLTQPAPVKARIAAYAAKRARNAQGRFLPVPIEEF